MKQGKLEKIEKRRFYLWILPGLVGLALFSLGPVVESLYLSFNSWPVIHPARWVGLQNYAELLEDDHFWQSLKVTSYYTALALPTGLITSLGWALLLNQPIKGRTAFRAIFYLPCVTSGVAIALMWMIIFHPTVGLANTVLEWFHLPPSKWVSSTKGVIPSFVLMNVWFSGGSMIIYLAALQGIPNQLYEAATMDGARSWTKFWSITLPMLTPVIFFNLIMSMIGSFRMFTLPYVMTKGGPGNASLFYELYIYRQAFEKLRMGYGASLAWILLVVIFICTLVLFKTSSKWVYYEA